MNSYSESWLALKRKAALADQFCEDRASGAYHAVKEWVIDEEQEAKMSAYTEKLKDEGMSKAKACNSKDAVKPSHAKYFGYQEGKHAKVFHGVDGSSNGPAPISMAE